MWQHWSARTATWQGHRPLPHLVLPVGADDEVMLALGVLSMTRSSVLQRSTLKAGSGSGSGLPFFLVNSMAQGEQIPRRLTPASLRGLSGNLQREGAQTARGIAT